MRTILIPSSFYDIDEVFAALLEDVEPLIYDFHAPFPVTHQKIMKYFRTRSPTHVGILLARDSAEEKAMKLCKADVPLLVNKPGTWAHFGVLAASIQAVTGLDKLYVLNKHLDTFEVAGLQKEIRAKHDVALLNSFDYDAFDVVTPQDIFFKQGFDSHCCYNDIVPDKSLQVAVREVLQQKIKAITGIETDDGAHVPSVVLWHNSFKKVWTSLKDQMAFKELEGDIHEIDLYFDKPGFKGLALMAHFILRIMFACKREAFDKPIGNSSLTFAACIELLLLPVLTLDTKLTFGFYGYIFGNDDGLKSRILAYTSTAAFVDGLVTPKVPVETEAIVEKVRNVSLEEPLDSQV